MLKKLNTDIQQVAEAIAATLEANVTIVDNNLHRVAGTGPYLEMIQKKAPQDSAFAKVLKTKETIVIENPGFDSGCQDCSVKERCVETYEICTPIIWQGEAIGVIGIFAFDQSQKKAMAEKKNQYLNFLHKMAALIASRFGEAVLYEELTAKNDELAAVIQNVHQGVLCLDSQGRIGQINAKARQLLGLKEPLGNLPGVSLKNIWPKALLSRALEEKQEFVDKEEYFETPHYRRGLLSTIRLIRQNNTIVGAVGTFTDLDDIQRSAVRVREHNDFTFDDLIGASGSFAKAKKRACQVAGHDSTVLITGESGTGKELFARAIHNAGSRSEYPFIGINCSAIPESLLESELFGYEPGAFTGADKKGKPGKIQLAHKGTFFLDEIGDMPLFLQAKLLRVLQERRITRVGGIRAIDIDVRIIAATNKNLEDLIDKKMFREDLYYRLNVIPLKLPPLRERKEDIPVFIEFFLKIYNTRFQKKILGFTPDAIDFFLRYSWPGNVRELENIVEYGTSFAEGDYMEFDDIKDRFRSCEGGEGDKSLRERVAEYERRAIKECLDKYGWDDEGKKKAADVLKMSRATLYRKLSQ
ncbi:MAG: sigma 54-interacting transcriptional regulator [Dethiobacter sp.]|jgi:transcriptional regulator with PAS, ATPase and Fis domain|nr:sigma 54-interacting transcriptional regulator [Dethiobacter sp.]